MALRAAKSDESLGEVGYCVASVGGRGRFRSGSVEAVREYDPGHAESQSGFAATPVEEAVARNGALKSLRVLRFHAGETNEEWQYSGN